MWYGDPPVGAPDGHQNVKTPATSPSAHVYLLVYERAPDMVANNSFKSFPRRCEGKKKQQKTNQYRKIVPSQGKVGLVKAFDRKVCGLQ